MNSFEQLAANSKGYARLLLTIGENRLELLAVEMQEELQQLLRLFLMSLGIAVFGLLAGITLSAALILVLNYPPATTLLYLAGFFTIAALVLFWRFARLLNNWHILSASIDQIKRDRLCRE